MGLLIWVDIFPDGSEGGIALSCAFVDLSPDLLPEWLTDRSLEPDLIFGGQEGLTNDLFRLAFEAYRP